MNKQRILKAMEAVVKNVMTSYQSDFYKYDTKSISNANEDELPKLWIVEPSATHLYDLNFKAWFTPEHVEYWDYLKTKELPYKFVWESNWYFSGGLFFLILPDGIRRIERKAVKEIVRDRLTPVIDMIKEQNGGKLPAYQQVDVEFIDDAEERIFGFIEDCEKHNSESLMNILERIISRRRHTNDYRIISCTDEAIYVSEKIGDKDIRFCGAIKFHGWPETGYKENGSVMLTPSYGWHMHT